ncbi:MAG: HmuY family protein [Bacteroidetes bacterium]|uniref:HmuY family protein n=1 Tax=Candidatus Cryptobacteroides avistercoris TaxID=2840758 RepID=A0A9D9IYH4_9BACT|nr:HmuY family protein [Candidatus Cryptobacteroides avistercoris]
MMKRLFLIAFLALLPSCNGIFPGIYDSGESDLVTGYGFIAHNPSDNSGKVYIDATDYTKWVYLDFHGRTAVTAGMSEEEAPAEWDIAVHRYDVKTNGAAVLETGITGLELFMSSGKMPEGEYVEDEWTTEKIIVDMSGMMDGNIGYSESWYNSELSKWLKVDTSTMPPLYSMSHKVYAVKLADGSNLALKLSNYMDASGVKGFMTIDYVYPVEF